MLRCRTISIPGASAGTKIIDCWLCRGASGAVPDAARTLARRRDPQLAAHGSPQVANVDVGLQLPAAIHRAQLGAVPLVVLARRDHPVVRGSLDRAIYLALEHVLVTGRRRGRAYEDGVLDRQNVSRRVRLRCQLHAVANELVSRTDLLLTMPRHHAERVNARIDNQLLEFPFEAPDFELYLYWHESAADDAANRWLRERVRSELGGTAALTPAR